MKWKIAGGVIGILLTGILYVSLSEAVPTKVIVRAKARDAQFIGTSMGGALVVIKNSETGEVLSRGTIEGRTGDVNRIIKMPIRRGDRLSDASTAKFETTVDIHEPKLVTIEVQGPLGWKQTMVKGTTQLWLIPGKDITGDGVILEFYGFAVDVITPKNNESIKLTGKKLQVPIMVKMVMI